MYSWGAGTSGQLGVSQANDVLRPQSVDPQLALPEQVSCGGHTSIFLKGIVQLMLLQTAQGAASRLQPGSPWPTQADLCMHVAP